MNETVATHGAQQAPPGRDLRRVGERVEALIEELAGLEPGLKERAEELVGLLVELYGAGLARIVEIVEEAGDPAGALLGRLTADDLVNSLLVLHGLHPVTLESRVQQALERVRPYLGSHGGGVELLGVENAVVRLRLEGSCDGCPSSAVTLKLAVERAIMEAAPEVVDIETEGATERAPGPKLLQITPVRRGGPEPEAAASDWAQLDGGSAGAPREGIAAVDLHGFPVLLCRAGGGLYAYVDRCAACESSLSGSGTLEGSVLTCASCRHRFDVRLAGRSLDAEGVHLDPLPLLEEAGAVRVAVPSGRA